MSGRAALSAMMFLLWSAAAFGVDRIVLEVDEATLAGVHMTNARATLDLRDGAPSLIVGAQRLEASEPTRVAFAGLRLDCREVVVKEPLFACRGGRIAAKGGPTRAIDMAASASFDSALNILRFESSGLALAGGRLQLAGTLADGVWTANGRASSLRIAELRELFAPWIALPAEYSLDGHLGLQLEGSGKAGSARMRIDASVPDLDFGNEAGTAVAEKVSLHVRGEARQTRAGLEIETAVDGASGQALAGPVLLDFGANPLQVTARGHLSRGLLSLGDISVQQKDLLAARASALLRADGAPLIQRAHVDLARLEFPAAYRSFLQIALAATDFGTLEAAGSASGTVEIENDTVSQLALRIEDIDLVDERTQFFMNDLQGELHWAPDVNAEVPESKLAWSKMRAYGLSGGTAQLAFRARGTGFELTREARLPLFDGAMLVHSLAARNLGGESPELDFDADIEPISMALLSRAFGWPELAGQLSGRIPGLTFRDKVLAFNGDVTAQVFDGTIVGRHFRLQDPLGPWPRLFADVTARRLDLQQVTSTFSIGTITGRLDADLAGLELFAWSPVAFDAKLYSTPGDRSPRRISQKAVTSISSIGGGSGGVTKALQSGVLRFFEEFRYDRIGLACQLRNEVCLMSGIEPRGDGYYIVKGSGLPRIDIIGNQGRVDWPRLLQQIEAGMRSNDVIVR